MVDILRMIGTSGYFLDDDNSGLWVSNLCIDIMLPTLYLPKGFMYNIYICIQFSLKHQIYLVQYACNTIAFYFILI